MRELTEEQKIQMDAVFNEPLSDRSKKPPKDYKPPVFKEDEGIQEFLNRVDEYNYIYNLEHP